MEKVFIKNKLKRQQGITLVALVVTIIVLIILATVSINAVLGENGIIQKAKQTKDMYENSVAKEEESLNELLEEYNNRMATNSIPEPPIDGDDNEIVEPPTEPEVPPVDPTDDWNLDKVNKVTSEDNIVIPVPKGYTASNIAGEKSVSTGFVIKEGNNGGATSGINEFVWVPVPEITDIYDQANNAGQLWDFGTSAAPKNPAVRIKYGPLTDHEPDVITGSYSGGDSTVGTGYDANSDFLQEAGLSSTATASDFKVQLQNEFNGMIESVRIYGGFYIGRYETGNLSQTKAVVQKGNTDIADQIWYTMYKVSKTIAANTNVTSSMIWGSQWDATLRWMQNEGTTNKVKNFATNSADYGNYTDSKIATGSNIVYAVNNIYDMAGNVSENTLEACTTNYRNERGGQCYYTDPRYYSASYRDNDIPNSSGVFVGTRSTLYITI